MKRTHLGAGCWACVPELADAGELRPQARRALDLLHNPTNSLELLLRGRYDRIEAEEDASVIRIVGHATESEPLRLACKRRLREMNLNARRDRRR